MTGGSTATGPAGTGARTCCPRSCRRSRSCRWWLVGWSSEPGSQWHLSTLMLIIRTDRCGCPLSNRQPSAREDQVMTAVLALCANCDLRTGPAQRELSDQEVTAPRTHRLTSAAIRRRAVALAAVALTTVVLTTGRRAAGKDSGERQ